MKKVTIPTCANPFVVIVNGMKYTYPAGETVEVPDDVAAVIEQHHDAHNNPKPEPATPPYSSGAKSWNDLEDKPFGDEIISCVDTLTWDGTPTDTFVDVMGAKIYHVSDSTPSCEELIGGKFVFSCALNGEVAVSYDVELTATSVIQVSGNCIALLNGDKVNAGIALEDGASFDVGYGVITLPKKGVYFLYTEEGARPYDSAYISALKIDGYIFTKSVTHKIDKKYLPDGVGGTKVIDLTKYAFDSGATFNDAIVQLFAQGGGQIQLATNNTTFWSDLNTDQEIVFLFDGSVMQQGMCLESRAGSIVETNGTPVFISYDFIMMTEVLARITITFALTVTTGTDTVSIGTTIILAIEPLNVPTT